MTVEQTGERVQKAAGAAQNRAAVIRQRLFTLLTVGAVAASSLLTMVTDRSDLSRMVQRAGGDIPPPSALTHDPEIEFVLKTLEMAFNLDAQKPLSRYLREVARGQKTPVRQQTGGVYTYHFSFPREGERNPAIIRMVLSQQVLSGSTDASIQYTFDRNRQLAGTDSFDHFNEFQLREIYPYVVGSPVFQHVRFDFRRTPDSINRGILAGRNSLPILSRDMENPSVTASLNSDGHGETNIHTQIRRR